MNYSCEIWKFYVDRVYTSNNKKRPTFIENNIEKFLNINFLRSSQRAYTGFTTGAYGACESCDFIRYGQRKKQKSVLGSSFIVRFPLYYIAQGSHSLLN